MIRTTIVLALILAGFGVMLFAAVISDPEATDEQLQKASLIPADIPEEARTQINPYAKDLQSTKRGGTVFSSQCVMCHGADGRGTGDLVERLALEIPDFTDAKMQAQWTDGAFFYVVNTGHGEMPGQQARLKDEMKWDLVNYVRTFSPNK